MLILALLLSVGQLSAQAPKEASVSVSANKPLNVRADILKNWIDYTSWLFSLILATAGVGGVCLALRTLKAIEKQANAQMDADRAWVLASVIGQPKEPITKSIIEEGIIPGIVWQIQVAGNTPARIISERYRCRTVSVDKTALPPKPELESVPVYLPNTNSSDGQIVFPPGYSYAVSIPIENGPGNLVERMTLTALGEIAFCAYGRIEYEDAFKRKGITQVCALYYPLRGGVIKSPDGTVLNPPGFRIGGPPGYNYNT